MKRNVWFNLLMVCGLLLVLTGSVAAQGPAPEGGMSVQAALGTAFSYQGYLEDGGTPVNGTCDLKFTLYDAATSGSTVGSTVTKAGVTVTDGTFTEQLDFGAGPFGGSARWLEVQVRCPSGSGSYTTLSPRQELTPAPYALYASKVGAHDHWGESWSGSGTGLTLSGGSTGMHASGTTRGVSGEAASTSGQGVYGVASATSGYAFGVKGESWSTSGRGVYGAANASSGTNYGVYGVSYSTDGHGVYGSATTTTGYTYGVYGTSASTNGRGLEGVATADSGYTYGVWGESASTDGRAVTGWATATSGPTRGVYGKSVSPSGYGVYGWASDTSGTDTSFGVYGRSESFSGLGVYGYAAATIGGTYGVWGESKSTSGIGVKGYVSATCCSTYGVYGQSKSIGGGRGVYGYASATSGNSVGVYGKTDSSNGYAGYFSGNVHVDGTLSKFAGSFKIDHPLDPANQYLSHSFVESPDMMNVYNGNITLGTDGTVWVYMPDYFEALNQDFRYQLTPIGAPGPNLYIAQKITNNRFEIAGGVPGMEVSWQVTGIRHDPYAVQNPIVVEEPKPADEKGTYLYPQGYGQPKSMGLDFQRNAEKDAQAGAMNNGQ